MLLSLISSIFDVNSEFLTKVSKFASEISLLISILLVSWLILYFLYQNQLRQILLVKILQPKEDQHIISQLYKFYNLPY